MKGELKWTLRISPRARYAKLQIKPFGGLEVVIPTRFPRRQIPELVQRHAHWARLQLAKQEQLREAITLPQQIELPFDNSVTAICYSQQPGSTGDLFAAQIDHRVVIDAATKLESIAQLRKWIRRRAWQQLPDLAAQISLSCGLEFNRLSIRSQKTRWGSCSSGKNISLNDQLLFVPPQSVEYLIIHELCHTRHMNHSPAFWRLVAEHCPDYRQQEKLLGRSRNWVPDWFLYGLYR